VDVGENWSVNIWLHGEDRAITVYYDYMEAASARPTSVVGSTFRGHEEVNRSRAEPDVEARTEAYRGLGQREGQGLTEAQLRREAATEGKTS